MKPGWCTLGARYFDPVTCRFISPDPSRFADSRNLYALCGNDPVNRLDPDGRLAKEAGSQVGGIGIGVAQGALNLGVELAGTPYDIGQALAYANGRSDNFTPVSSMGKAAAGGAGTFDILGGAVKGIVTAPIVVPFEYGKSMGNNLIGQGNPEAIGQNGFNFALYAGLLKNPAPAAKSTVVPKQITVIGSRTDTLAAKGWPGHNVLDVPTWTAKGNIKWLDSAIRRGDEIYLATDPAKHAAILDSLPTRPFSAFTDLELPYLQWRGYVQEGVRMVPKAP